MGTAATAGAGGHVRVAKTANAIARTNSLLRTGIAPIEVTDRRSCAVGTRVPSGLARTAEHEDEAERQGSGSTGSYDAGARRRK